MRARACSICRESYYRRNQSVTWKKADYGWTRTVLRGHPECLKLYSKVVRLYRRAAA
jgi:hypothetical protein